MMGRAMRKQLLNAALIESLKRSPPSARAEIWDGKIAGLCLRISPNGRGSYSIRYRPKAGTGLRRVTLGSWDDLRLGEARERAAVIRGEVAGGADPQARQRESRQAAATALTFDKLAQRYLDEYAKPRKSSWANDVLYLARPRAMLGDREAKGLLRRDFIGVLDSIKVTAPVSANRTQSILVTLLNWASDEDPPLIDINVLAGARKRAVETPRERSLSDDELRIVWNSITQSHLSDSIRSALLCLTLTGQRPGEVVGAHRSEFFDLDNANARWEIPAERVKSRKPHLVPLCPLVISIVKPLVKDRRPDDGVFASRYGDRKVLARHTLSHALRRILETLPDGEQTAALKLKRPTPHAFRATVATGLSRLGISREDRLAVLGHSFGDVHARHYDHHERAAEKRAALLAWENQVRAIVGLPR
jgi:integrase